MATRLAERYGHHPALLIWHVSNEYGGACFCETCASAFRGWLQQKYGSLDELNQRWWTPFWAILTPIGSRSSRPTPTASA